MNFYVVIGTLLFSILFNSVFSQNDCKNDFCYGIVHKAHSQLRELLEKGKNVTKSSKYPTILNPENLGNLIDRIKIIENKLKKQNSNLDKNVDDLERVFKNLTFFESKLDDLKAPANNENLEKSVEEIHKIIKQIREKMEILKNLVLENQATNKLCDEAKSKGSDLIQKATELLNEFNTIISNHSNLISRKDKILFNLDEVMADAKENLQTFDDLEIPENLANNYLNNPIISELITNLENDKQEAEKLFKNKSVTISEDFQNEINKINNTINKLRDEAIEIRTDVIEHIKKLPQLEHLPIDEIKSLINRTKKDLRKLNQKIDSFNFEDLEKNLLNNKERLIKQVEKFTNLLNQEGDKIQEHDQFLDVLIRISERTGEIREEVEKAKLTIELIRQKKQIRADFKEIKNIYNELIRYPKKEICKLTVFFEN